MQLNGGIEADHILYNYVASSLEISGVEILGTTLAPRTDVWFKQGLSQGSLMAKSLTSFGEDVSQGQINWKPFEGCIPVPFDPACY